MITALEYFKIKQRMTKQCTISCDDCPLDYENRNITASCRMFEEECPEKAVSIIEQWGKEHPIKTYLSDFLEKYPKAKLREVGIPECICPSNLGLKDIKNKNKDVCYLVDCITCWNQELEE